jgi:hypothetical protein
MKHLRLSIAGLMTLVALVGVGFAGLRASTPLWAAGLFTAAVALPAPESGRDRRGPPAGVGLPRDLQSRPGFLQPLDPCIRDRRAALDVQLRQVREPAEALESVRTPAPVSICPAIRHIPISTPGATGRP